MRPSFLSLSRYQSIDRNRVFNAIKTFVENEGTSLFQRVYSYLDFYYESVNQVNSELDKNWEKDVDKRKSEISGLFKYFNEEFDYHKSHSYDTYMIDLLKKYKAECDKVIVDGEPDLARLRQLLLTANKGMENQLYQFGKDALIKAIDALRANNLLHSKMMKDAANAFRSDKCLDALKEISGKLESALNEHTEESIIKEFEGKI